MSRFALRYPYLIIVACLVTCVVRVTSLVRLPVDLFPAIKIPVVVVATFYSGMPPEQIENDITGRFERFFTLGSGIDHIESRSLTGVSLIRVYFQPGTNADSAVSTISNLAMAQLRRLPPGTLPPVVLKFDASSLPVCLITLKGQKLNKTQLHDIGQFTVRNLDLVRSKPHDDMPELSVYLQTGGLVDAVVNLGLPAPIDIQMGGNNLESAFNTARELAANIRTLPNVSDVLIPQDIDYPGLELNVNREMAGRLGLNSREVIDNVITALSSNGMIAPSYWVDPKSG